MKHFLFCCLFLLSFLLFSFACFNSGFFFVLEIYKFLPDIQWGSIETGRQAGRLYSFFFPSFFQLISRCYRFIITSYFLVFFWLLLNKTFSTWPEYTHTYICTLSPRPISFLARSPFPPLILAGSYNDLQHTSTASSVFVDKIDFGLYRH